MKIGVLGVANRYAVMHALITLALSTWRFHAPAAKWHFSESLECNLLSSADRVSDSARVQRGSELPRRSTALRQNDRFEFCFERWTTDESAAHHGCDWDPIDR